MEVTGAVAVLPLRSRLNGLGWFWQSRWTLGARRSSWGKNISFCSLPLRFDLWLANRHGPRSLVGRKNEGSCGSASLLRSGFCFGFAVQRTFRFCSTADVICKGAIDLPDRERNSERRGRLQKGMFFLSLWREDL